MRRALAVLFPVCAAVLLVVGIGQARADMCLGGPERGGHPDYATPPPDTGAGDATDADDPQPDGAGEVSSRPGALPRQMGAYLLIAASVSTGWLVFRRRDPDGRE